jgi:ribosome-binding protein aMBF1 (putative translation factor)
VARPRQERPAIVTVPLYLSAVQSMHGLALADMARALRVNASVVRRWRRGTLVPTWSRLRAMTALWGGDAELLALGAALQRFSRHTGVSLDDAVRMVRQGRRTAPTRRPPEPVRDRRQLPLL